MKSLAPILSATLFLLACENIDTFAFITETAPGDDDSVAEEDDPFSGRTTGFRAVTAGDQFSCTLHVDGTVNCWGYNGYGQAEAPEGKFTEVVATKGSACGITVDHSLKCWGRLSEYAVPTGEFAHVSPIDVGGCALKRDGRAVCWYEGQILPVPDMKFEAVAIGPYVTCGLLSNGEVVCWQLPDAVIVAAPTGKFTALSRDNQPCGLTEQANLECTWPDGQETLPGPFLQASGDASLGCGITTNHDVTCWGNREGLLATPSGKFVQVDMDGSHACALREDGEFECWGFGGWGEATRPGGKFLQVASGRVFGCGIRTDRTVECWNDEAPEGEFLQIASANSHACGIKVDGTLACWGFADYGQPVPSGQFTDITCGREYSCAVREDGDLVCWGNLPEDHPQEVSGSFVKVASGTHECWGRGCTQGGMHTCALDNVGQLACWGENPYNQATAPAGTFSHVVAAGDRSCALDLEGTMTCWGRGSLQPMTGAFKMLTLGSHGLTCGLHEDGSVECVIDSPYGFETLEPPKQKFTQIQCTDFCCGVTVDGDFSCWDDVVR